MLNYIFLLYKLNHYSIKVLFISAIGQFLINWSFVCFANISYVYVNYWLVHSCDISSKGRNKYGYHFFIDVRQLDVVNATVKNA